MEHIKEVLGNFHRGEAIPSQKTIEPESVEPTLEEKREELRKTLGVASLGNTFEALKPWTGTEKSVAAFKALASGETEWKMLLDYGGVGNGKTHFCEATAIQLYKRGVFCRVLTMDSMMSALKKCMEPDPHISYEELLSNYSNAERLIIDDADGTDWAFGELEKMIRIRYRERLFTILTTNRDLTELPERLVSRFRDPDVGRLILNSGDDYRGLKGK